MMGFHGETGMVSKWWTRRAPRSMAECRHQSKIYAESNQSDFSRIFGELSSMQTLAIYRQLLSQGPIARSIATVARAGAEACDRNGDQKETAGVARCFFCFAWHSGSGWCSCCCPERRRLIRTNNPGPGGRKRARLRRGGG